MTGEACRQRFLEGERIYLREVRPADADDTYYQWMNDPSVVRYLESRFYPIGVEKLRDYIAARSGDQNSVFMAIILRDGDRHIGNVKLGPIDWIHRTADIGLLIGEKDCWGRGYATEVIRLVAGYAFDTLNLHKLTAGCYSNNPGSARAFQKAGFEIEGVRKQQYFSDGVYVDAVLLGLIGPRRPGDSGSGQQ